MTSPSISNAEVCTGPSGASTMTPGRPLIVAKRSVKSSRHQSGDLNALTQLLASDVRIVTDGCGRVRAALNVVEGADRAARFLVGATRKRAGA